MPNMREVSSQLLINQLAEDLKSVPEIKPTEWAGFAKTGVSRERPPMRSDWWHVRAAAILRKVALLGPIGVSKLRTKFGGRGNRGYKPDKTYKAAGNHIRKILQQLTKADLIKDAQKGAHKGKILTPKGQSMLDKAAKKVK